MRPRLALTLLLAALVALSGCSGRPRTKTPLVVFAAGSLIRPFGALEKAFEARYPQIDVMAEYHGSIQVMRHVTDIGEAIDVVATADYALIPSLMYAGTDPDTGLPYASWYLRFATNRMVLAYTANSRYAGEITADNWFEVIARPDVRFGIADPRFDACGYRALMVLKLAEEVYQQKGILRSMVDDRFETAITSFWEDGETLITVPELLTPRADSGIYMRGSSMQLQALLQSGDVDYAFLYESEVRQLGFSMVPLPPAADLGEVDQEAQYGTVTVKLDFRRFASVEPEFVGGRIGYGITVPSNAPHPHEAAQFIEFLLGPEGRKVMADNYHPEFDQVVADGFANVPASLQPLVVPAEP
ncbi:MAG: tungstate ABC transporter substrate-binding protein WtpA [Anaerolineae bacterium]